MYFLKSGWMDKTVGYQIAMLSAYASYKRYAIAIQLKAKILEQ